MGRRTREHRRGRREEAVIDTAVAKISQPVNNLPTYDMISEEGIELIHEKSLEVLSDVGIDFYDDV